MVFLRICIGVEEETAVVGAKEIIPHVHFILEQLHHGFGCQRHWPHSPLHEPAGLGGYLQRGLHDRVGGGTHGHIIVHELIAKRIRHHNHSSRQPHPLVIEGLGFTLKQIRTCGRRSVGIQELRHFDRSCPISCQRGSRSGT